jgi:predicted ATPase/DNA-binding CsgD family transcriptional regulator
MRLCKTRPNVAERTAQAVYAGGEPFPATATVAVLVVDREPGATRTTAVFSAPGEALTAALEARAAGSEPMRMALHAGEARIHHNARDRGPALETCQRLADIANPGQILVSGTAAATLERQLPAEWRLRDLGLHRLRDLSSAVRVFELHQSAADSIEVSLRSLACVPNNLPVHFTSFVGRHNELAELHRLLGAERLVTITGVGGAGKTRLAAQAVADLIEQWPDGVWWVELGSLTDPALVADVVATTVGVLVEPVQGPLRSLVVQSRERRMVVCLDNCEQVLDGAADVAQALLRGCPEVTAVTTSREPLGVAGEIVWRTPGLAEDDAMALFRDRANTTRSTFKFDEKSEAAVRRICARLDGVPLALELAAAWLRTLTPRQIEAGLDDRFALLVRGMRGAVARHHTLAASIDWSHALLEEADRLVFRRLSIFAADFGLDAAAGVAGARPLTRHAVLEAISRLVDKSLVLAEERNGEARYRLPETIRHYAADRLAEADDVDDSRDRHLDHFLAMVEANERGRQHDLDAWRTRIERDYHNLRSALEWGLAAPDSHRGRRLAAALPWLWHLHGHGQEGIAYLRRAIDRSPDDRSNLQARLLTGLALVADTAGPIDLEFDAAQRALAVATEQGDQGLRALCLTLSAVGRFYTDFASAWALAEEAIKTAEATGDAFVVDAAHALQGIILHLRDQHVEAESRLRSAIEKLMHRHRGIAATALGYQAAGALFTGDVARARRLAQEAVQVAEPLGDYLRVGSTRGVLALVHAMSGDFDLALRLMQPVLRLVEGAEDDVFVPGLARTMGTLLLWRGDARGALEWFGREPRSSDAGSETYLAAQALPGQAWALIALGRIEEAASVLDRAVAAARRLDMPRVVADALELQAHVAHDLDDAIDLHHQALALRAEHGLSLFAVDSLDALGTLGARSGPTPEVVRVLAASNQARTSMGYVRGVLQQPAYASALDRLRAALGDKVFDTAWTAGCQLTLDEAMAYVRRSRGARRRPSTGWGSLTPTELEVVRLVVDGLNNPEIGSRLFMSRATVKTHLAHVYAKLGVANRTGLASLAGSRADFRRQGEHAI